MSIAAVIICMQALSVDIYFISLGQTASSGMAAGSYDRCMFSFVKKLRNFQSGWSILHSHWQYASFVFAPDLYQHLILSVFLIIALLMVWCWLTMYFIWIFLMAMMVSMFSYAYYHFCISFNEGLSPLPVFYWVGQSLVFELYELFLYSRYKTLSCMCYMCICMCYHVCVLYVLYLYICMYYVFITIYLVNISLLSVACCLKDPQGHPQPWCFTGRALTGLRSYCLMVSAYYTKGMHSKISTRKRCMGQSLEETMRNLPRVPSQWRGKAYT